MKGIQIYVRTFDIVTLELSSLRQIYVEQDATYEEFAYIIEE